MSITLILGGARSGKSAFAEQLAAAYAAKPVVATSGATHRQVVYIATATSGDAEMDQRIAHHRNRRPTDWRTVEAPLALADALVAHATPDTCVMVDCLTLWLSNLLFQQRHDYSDTGPIDPGPQFAAQCDALLKVLPILPGLIVLVSNEIGFGVTPMGAVSRFFVDEAGRLNQRVAALAQQVRLIVAGCPVPVKG